MNRFDKAIKATFPGWHLKRETARHEAKYLSSVGGAYDAAKLVGPLIFRKSRSNEKFQGIGIKETAELKPEVLLLSDQVQTLCVYPYRDANSTKITNKTQNLLLIAAGVPNIPSSIIEEGLQTVTEQVLQVAGGSIEHIVIKTLP